MNAKIKIFVAIILVVLCVANCFGAQNKYAKPKPDGRYPIVVAELTAKSEIQKVLTNYRILRNRFTESHRLFRGISKNRTEQVKTYKDLIKNMEANITQHLQTIIDKTEEVVLIQAKLQNNTNELFALKVAHNTTLKQLTATNETNASLQKELAETKNELLIGRTQIKAQNLTIANLTEAQNQRDQSIQQLKQTILSNQNELEEKIAFSNDLLINAKNSNSQLKSMNETIIGLQARTNADAEQIKELKSKLEAISSCCSAKSCKSFGQSTNVHLISVPGAGDPFNVRCEGKLAGPGWTVIQRRFNGSVNFYRGWDEYRKGFGDLNGEFFIGLEKLHHMTAAEQQELYIQLEDFSGETRFARYDEFKVGSERTAYTLESVGKFNGDIKNSLYLNEGHKFSTFDRDNDADTTRHCAVTLQGGWWYGKCGLTNLNGFYVTEDAEYDDSDSGIFWDNPWRPDRYSFKAVQMMIRNKNN